MKKLLLSASFLILACTTPNDPDIADETGTKTGNAMCLNLYTALRKEAQNACIYLIPYNFNPVTDDTSSLISNITDSSGYVKITDIPVDTYNIECISENKNTKAFIPNVFIDSASEEHVIDTLFSTFNVYGYVEQQDWLIVESDAFIKGTRYMSSIDNTGLYNINELPRGDYLIDVEVYNLTLIYAPDTQSNTTVINKDSLYIPESVNYSYEDSEIDTIIVDTIKIRNIFN